VPKQPELTAGSRELIVSWRTTELAASYEVWYGQNNNPNQAQKYGGDIAETETVITGLTNETTYYVWIRAKNIIGISGFSVSSNAAPSAFAVPPLIPVMPNINIGSGSLDVSWQPTEGALVYEIWKGETNNLSTAVKHGTDLSGTFTAITGLTNGTTYYIWIRAKNNTGASGYSPMANGTPSALAAKPLNPQTAPVVIAGSGQLTVSWQAVEGASVYEIWTGTANDSSMAEKYGNDVSALSAVITGLTNGTTYFVWIKAKNSLGTSEFSPAASGTPQIYAVPPVAPQAPVITIGNGRLSVSWTAVLGAAAYEIWTATANSSSSAVKYGEDVNTSTSVIISGLNNGTTYYVWLKAKNGFGTSDFSSVSSGKPIANAAAPSLISSNAQITVNWDAIAGADQYDVFIGTGTNPPQTASRTVNAPITSAVFTSLVNGTNYNVWIQGKNATGTGALSNYANAKPIANIGTVSISAGNQRLSVNWASVAGADQYEVYHSASNTMPGSPSQTVTGTTATISSLVNGTTYYVWIVAKNQNGSNMSVVASGKPLGTPGAPILTPSYRQLGVTWTSVAGADEYEVYYGIGTATTLALTIAETSAIITGLTNGTTYHIRLRAKNASGVSEFGASVSSTFNMIPGLYQGTVKIGEQNLSTALSWISANVVSGDEFIIVLGGNESIAPRTLSYSSKTVGITLMGSGSERIVTLSSNGSMFTVGAGVTLTLDGNTLLVGRSANNDSLVQVNASGSLIMNDGVKIRGNINRSNLNNANAGGINISSGTFVMNGGIISENQQLFNEAGGVSVSSGTFTMNGGEISRNTAAYTGGGIVLRPNAIFIMNGGKIIENSARAGGGISIYSGAIFTMNNGMISKNNGNGSYGGSGVQTDGIFIMNGGTINGNISSASEAGRGIFVSPTGFFTMHGGVISGNTGNGVFIDYFYSNGTFKKLTNGSEVNSGIIYGSEETGIDKDGFPLRNSGGAVYFDSSTILRRNTTVWETDQIDTTTGRGLSARGNPPFGQ